MSPSELRLLTELRGNLSLDELSVMTKTIPDILENIVDIFDDTPPMEIIAIQGISMQDVFSELEQIIPHYTPLLIGALSQCGDETYMDETELLKYMQAESPEQIQIVPKLYLEGGEMGFALMQAAAWKAGLSDDNIRLWYTFLLFMLTAPHSEEPLH